MRKISWSKYTLVLLTASLIFIIGVLLSEKISSKNSEEILKTQQELKNYILNSNLQSEIVAEYICKVDVFEITKEKVELGKKIEVLEKNLGKENEIVKNLKSDYSLLSIRQWLLIKKVKEKCNKNVDIIIFFYSNKVNVSESESQGFVLDYLYQKHPNSIVTYAFDIDKNNPALNTIKEIYGIKETPSIVVNEKLFAGLQSKEKIESLLS
jgi:hypothetical protein